MSIGRIHPTVTIARVEKALAAASVADDDRGFCTACGADAWDVHPAARQLKCDRCGQDAVYGAEELFIYLVGY